MKKLIRTLVFTVAALVIMWCYLPSALSVQPTAVTVVSPLQATVYETVTCDGTLESGNSVRLSTGMPAEILEVYVKEGESVAAGQPIMRYRSLSDGEIAAGLFTSEIADQLQATEALLNEEMIFAAAEYYAVSGELPSFFKNFYLPNDITGEHRADENGVLLAPISGTVTMLRCSPGERVSGLFSLAAIEDRETFIARLRVPETALPKLAIGLPVNLTAAALGDRVIPATLVAIGDRAVTTGGLLGKSETCIEVDVMPHAEDTFLSGITVRGTVFLSVYEDAVIIPHEAITAEKNGAMFVYRCVGDRLCKTPIVPVFENDDGVISSGGVAMSDLLVRSPDETVAHGDKVRIQTEDPE